MAKVMISLPDDLLERIDHEAERRSTSRSAFLRQAAARELGQPDPEEVDALIEKARAALDAGPGFDSAEVIREDRDTRDDRRPL